MGRDDALLPSIAPVVNGTFNHSSSDTSQLLTGTGFQGIDDSQCGCDPPDVQVAAGPGEVVEMVNLYVGVWNETGVAIAGESLSTFFSTSDYLSDPRVVYDNLSRRYFASILDFDTGTSVGHVYFAVSANSSAEGNWTVYKILSPGSGALPDQPILGENSTLLGFGANIFSSSYNGAAEYWVVNKSAVLNGTTAAYAAFGPDASAFSVHPGRTLASGAPLYFVESLKGNPGTLDVFRVNGIPPAVTNVTITNLTVGSISSPPPSPTPSGGDIDSATFRVADVIWWAGKLYVTYGDSCRVGSVATACLRLDIVNTTPSIVVEEDLNIGLAGTFLYYPAISLDAAGDLILVFGLSSSTLYPSIAATTHLALEGPAVFSPFSWIRHGSAGRSTSSCGSPPSTCRFGDYFGAGTDPGGNVVWVAGEYLTASTTWQTWLSPVEAAPPPTASVVLPAGADVGQAANFSVAIANSSCASGLTDRCTLSVPLGDGTNFTVGCGTLGDQVAISHAYPAAQSYTVGTGGRLDVYLDPSCDPANLSVSVPLSGATLQVSSRPTVNVVDSLAGAGDVGAQVTFDAFAQGGSPPYQYSWTGLPSGCPTANSSAIACALTSAGNLVVQVSVSDLGGASVVAGDAFEVDLAPAASLSVGSARVDAGENLSFSGAAHFGSGTYQFSWIGLPPGCFDVNSASQTCSASEPGRYTVSLVATDSRGFAGRSPGVNLTVLPALAVTLSFSPTAPTSGDTVIVTASVSGGAAPYSYAWSGASGSCPVSSTSTFRCTFPQGAHLVTVTVRDGANGTRITSDVLAVRPTSATSILGGGWALPAALAVGSLVVIAAVGIVLSRRGRPGRRIEPPSAGSRQSRG